MKSFAVFTFVLSMLFSGFQSAYAKPASQISPVELQKRLKLDFSLTEYQLLGRLQGKVADLQNEEFEAWLKAGYFEKQEFDGLPFYFGRSESNLFFRHPELAQRQLQPKDESLFAQELLENCREIKLEGGPYVLPTNWQIDYKVSLKPNLEFAGKNIKAWLPLPRNLPYQGHLELLSNSSEVNLPEDEVPSFAGFMQQSASANGEAEFAISYNYQSQAVHFELEPEKAQPYNPNSPDYKSNMVFEAHLSFSPALQKLSEEIVGAESNPILKAKKIYNWITENIKYSYAPEYSTFENITETIAQNRYGDCGQQALLFISLCRLNGIPARFQSGWLLFPHRQTIHDWAEVYFEGYSWVPVDPYMGGQAIQYLPSLTPNEKEEVRDFYFGGLDQYRLTVNTGHSQDLWPKKCSERSDDVDFQRAELETEDCQNIYFDRFKYSLDKKELEL